MKFLIIMLLLFLNYTPKIYASIPKWNPCINAKNNLNFKRLNLSSNDMEACFQSALSLIENPKTIIQGIDLLARFLYIKDEGYRRGAILQLGNTQSSKAIKPLIQKGKHAVDSNNAGDLEIIVTSLVTLNAHSASRELASYAKGRKKYSMMRVIGDEYLVYTSNENFEKMEDIVGKTFE